MLNGRSREMGLGNADLVPLAEARELVHRARVLKAEGIEPIDNRRAAKAVQVALAITVADCLDAFLQAHGKACRSSSSELEWRAMFRNHAHDLLRMPVNAITTAEILGRLQPLWTIKPNVGGRL